MLILDRLAALDRVIAVASYRPAPEDFRREVAPAAVPNVFTLQRDPAARPTPALQPAAA